MNFEKITFSNSSNNQSDTEAYATNHEKVWEIIERYIDQVDVTIYDWGLVLHPVCLGEGWKIESGFPDLATVKEIMNKPDGLQKINNMAKATAKKFLRKRSLKDIFQCIEANYGFKVLRAAKEYISTDDLSQLLRATWEASDFSFNKDDDFSNDDLWELLQSCDPQKFMTSEERGVFLRCSPHPLFQGEFHTNPFVWTDNAAGLILDEYGRFGEVCDYCGYSASIAKEDIFAVIIGDYVGYIVNPDRLQCIEEGDLRYFCERDELDEKDWEDWAG